MKILQLSAENVLRLEAVKIQLDGKSIVIGGDNEQGKTSAVNIAKRIMEGGRTLPAKPVHNGAESGYDEVVLDNGMRARRDYTADGKTRLTVVTEDGAKVSNPQAVLDALFGDLTFDPMKFDSMDDKEQAAVVARITGLSVNDLDQEDRRLREERTLVGREVKTAKGAADGLPEFPFAVAIDVTGLLAKQREAQAQQEALAQAHREEHAAEDSIAHAVERVADCRRAMVQAEENEKSARARLAQYTNAVKVAANAMTLDADEIAEQIAGAGESNAQVQANVTKANACEVATAKQAEYDRLSKCLDKIAADKQARIAAVKMPVEGMSLADGCVTLGGIPWKQCSSAQRMEAMVALGFSANKKLRLMLVREGSNLDRKHLAQVLELADKYDGQIIMERVGDGAECSIIIEDGRVKGAKEGA